MSAEIEIDGLDELMDSLKKLPHKMSSKMILKAQRKAAKPLVKSAQSKAPVSNITRVDWYGKRRTIHPGDLKKSIGTIKGRNKTNPTTFVGPKVSRGRKRKHDAWYAHFPEFGTDGYTVKKGPLKGKFFPGQPAQPYMRPAYDETKDEVLDVLGDELGKIVHDHFKKTLK
ncbi:HK97-gp10 family putative phage morphogenesis protein [Marinifilum flexuosum]|uniref:HK97 gp10 family phage protein n=1 Tax=Marinifilum flexuosum TaxID=1117708 RepID=A0A419WMW5_9BACT|nr:HK97-gp10 family putative phage morphogenesis protein [Marinifilum flexuosum]RKD96782.1 HK97 gp10 family phage protein [Marinifilum flexuosum]